MKKKVITGLLALTMAAGTLAGCGSTASSGNSSAGGTETASASGGDEGKVINIYSWNDEFRERLEAVYPEVEETSKDGTVTTLKDGTEIHWIINPNQDGVYQQKLDEALLKQADASADDKIDIFLSETDYVFKYTDKDADVAMPLKDLGIDPDKDLADQYDFTRTTASDSDGVQRGSTWQCCPGLLVYRRDIAQDVFGTDDPAAVGEKVKDWDTLKATAEELKAKGYYTFASYADTFRLYGNSISESWVQPGDTTVKVDPQIMNWIDNSKEWLDAGYLNPTVKGQWNDDWNKAMSSQSNVFAFLLPAWGIDFVLNPNWDGDAGAWAVTNPPQEYNWGGSYIHAATGTDNPEHAKDIILAMTADKDNLLKISKDYSDFTNTKSGMQEAATDDANFSSEFLGGQNAFQYFAPVAENIKIAPLSAYDQGCVELIQNSFSDYFQGEVDFDKAKANFETAIKEGKPWTVMCAYNRLNGEFGSENKKVLNDVLRDEWAYEGLVVTDWGATNDRVKGLEAGQDLEMPSSGGVNDRAVLEAVQEGKITEAQVDVSVRRLLELIAKADEKPPVEPFVPKTHHELAQKIASECIVLLKNEEQQLPLAKTEKIALIGEFAVKSRIQGGGSSHINPTFLDTLLEEMQKRGGDAVLYEKGFSVDAESLDEAELERAIAAAKAADKVVLCMGLPESYETEGLDRKHLNLPGAQLEMIRVLKQYNPNLIVVLNNGAPVVMPFEDDVKAIVEGYLLGQAGSGAMASILYGEVNPSGKLAETFPMRLEDTPAYLNFPGEGYQVEYREGVFVGYRHYDSKKIRPQFAFGEGLSYTTFSYGSIETDQESILDTDQLRVKVRVTNTGKRAGKETVQLYVHDCQNEIIRPEKELKGFVKLSLEPGETKTAEFVLNKRSFAYYDVEQKDFLVQSGQFEILVGASSRDIRLKKTVTVTSTAKIHKHFHANTTFGELYAYLPTRPIAEERMDYFKRESGIDFEMGENAEDFAFRVICDFPLKTLVTFTEGRYSRKQLAELLEQVNKIGEG